MKTRVAIVLALVISLLAGAGCGTMRTLGGSQQVNAGVRDHSI